MDRVQPESLPKPQRETADWPKLIRKLRWLGLEDEARMLEQALGKQPADQRGSVAADPRSTD